MDTVYTIVSNVSSQTSVTYLIGYLKDFILVATAITGAIVAVNGLNAWKKQMKGRTEYDISRNLLRAIYKTKEGVDHVRNAMLSVDEEYFALKETGIEIPANSFDILGKGTVAVYEMRWKYLADALSELHVQIFEAKVLWGMEIESKIINIFKHVNTLRDCLDQYLKQDFKKTNNQKEQKEIESIVCSTDMVQGSLKKSDYGQKLDKIIEEIENYISRKTK